jgi:choline dehydrogenase-like flavoprotein
MLIDARQVDSFANISSDVCIVGAGAAGITMALELAGKGIKVAVLEGGGLRPDAATQSLYAGESVGLSHEPPEESRSRYLGGSTNCWGGWCRPLDALDFEVRPWVPDSGWPIGRSDLLPYYKRSHRLLQLREFDYDVGRWSSEFAKANAALFSVEGSGLHNVVSQLSPPTRFGSVYRAQLEASDVKLFLFANALKILANDTATQATGVAVGTLNRKRFEISSKVVVLAAGGMENPRLLLLSNDVEAAGLGNGRDLVGRYYMDHPRIHATRVSIAAAERYRPLYDATLPKIRSKLGRNNATLAAHLAPTADAQRGMRLPNSRTYLVARSGNDVSKSYFALKALRRSLLGRKQLGYPLSRVSRDVLRQLPVLLAHAPKTALTVGEVLFEPFIARRDFYLETVIEPVPNRESRVFLSDQRDQLGARTIKLDWRLTEQDKDHYASLNRLIVAGLIKSGAVAPSDVRLEQGAPWPDNVMGCWHHMGTTRMSDDPAKGVVDADCKVHGVHNLFIAGSSVFPPVGSDSPTITLVALALRLCDRILRDFERAPTGVESRAPATAVPL